MWQGKVAIVTGGAGGIGKALCDELTAKGARVVAWDLDAKGLGLLSEEAARFGRELFTDGVDVTSTESVRRARDRVIDQHGRIDFWFNNAGISGLGGFLEQGDAVWRRVIEVNLNGVMLGTQIAVEYFEGRGAGQVVNIASVAGIVGAPYLAAYSAAKHGVVGFTRGFREELKLRDSPIRLCLVCPGFVDTALVARGERLGFPEWLSWALATPQGTSREILRGIEAGREEIFPTTNGRLLLNAYSVFPRATARSARLLFVRQFKDLFLNRYNVD